MRFSVLLPTRNRLDLLRYAVESVRAQDYQDWEVVVADNASEADVCAYVASLDEPRVRCHRSEDLVPVTENWNKALERSAGDYVIMLGDDDALMPGCLGALARLADEWRRPQAIYVQALQYAYPGVVPGHDAAFVQTGYNEVLPADAKAPFLLARDAATRLAREAMAFRVRFGFNMQHFVVSRELVEALRPKGPFFQSPYPDYYAANAVLLAARTIIVDPQPRTMIGISPKSFGFYFQNRREGEGVEFLQNLPEPQMVERLRGTLVPGSNMNDSWLVAMETLAGRFAEVPGLRVSYRRYRLLQYSVLAREEGTGALLRHVRWWECLLYAPAAAAYGLAYLLPAGWRGRVQARLRAALSAYPRFDPQRRTVPYRNILEAAQGEADRQ